MLRVSRMVMVLAAVVSVPAAGIAIWSITHTVSQMFDPCVRWDGSGSTSGSLSIGPNDACRAVTVNGESRLGAVTRAALVPGVVLMSTVMALIGFVRSRRWLIFAASLLMFAETPVVFTIAPLTFLSGVAYLILANAGWRSRPVGEVTQ